ncbi:DUF3606 domain-containing protein [Rhodopseudomonas sp. B29]|uniref:DUF3606 domain-containing protein n=1 Tax=Rhodopseudomonas sp. B29 TaxID=95607 RepID=UPI000344DFF7|nr:DUF3606 domain-containing protein [Rhodopseudomonas sp. B29]
MADDKSKRDYRDRSRINTKESYEMEYWKKKFGVSGQQIAGAVRAVGTSVKKVANYLKNK